MANIPPPPTGGYGMTITEKHNTLSQGLWHTDREDQKYQQVIK